MSHEKRKAPDQPRQANVLRQKKSLFDFYCLRLFDLEGLAPAAGHARRIDVDLS